MPIAWKRNKIKIICINLKNWPQAHDILYDNDYFIHEVIIAVIVSKQQPKAKQKHHVDTQWNDYIGSDYSLMLLDWILIVISGYEDFINSLQSRWMELYVLIGLVFPKKVARQLHYWDRNSCESVCKYVQFVYFLNSGPSFL